MAYFQADSASAEPLGSETQLRSFGRLKTIARSIEARPVSAWLIHQLTNSLKLHWLISWNISEVASKVLLLYPNALLSLRPILAVVRLCCFILGVGNLVVLKWDPNWCVQNVSSPEWSNSKKQGRDSVLTCLALVCCLKLLLTLLTVKLEFVILTEFVRETESGLTSQVPSISKTPLAIIQLITLSKRTVVLTAQSPLEFSGVLPVTH